MRIPIIICCCIFISGQVFGQKEKVKGNKIVMTDEKIVEAFHTIAIYNNFEVTLQEDNDHIISIEADSNLQELIDVEIQDSILKIKSDKELRRAKALNIKILYGTELKKIRVYDKVNLTSKSPVQSANLALSVNDQAEVFLTIETQKLNGKFNGKSVSDLHVSATDVSYQVNENADLKGIITADTLNIDLYQKSSAKLEGEIKSMRVRTDNDSDFYGEKLASQKTTLIAEASSDCYLLTNQEIIIEAADKSEVYILGEPKIQINKFTNEASLYKKDIDYTPSKLKF